jgi:hypothetical protein
MMALAALAVIVSACSPGDREPIVRTVIVTPEIPTEAKLKCADPVNLPDRDLTGAETVTLWGRDRAALRICETRRAAAVGEAKPK